MQRLQEHFKRVSDKQKMLNADIEKQCKKLDSWSKELRESLTEDEKQKLDEEKKEREKEVALKKVLEIERQHAKQKLEMEIEELKGKLQVMKHLGDEDDATVQEEIKEMNNELQTKMEEVHDMEISNQTLMVKERQNYVVWGEKKKKNSAATSSRHRLGRTSSSHRRRNLLDLAGVQPSLITTVSAVQPSPTTTTSASQKWERNNNGPMSSYNVYWIHVLMR